MSITFESVYALLRSKGYQIVKEPGEMRPPKEIEMKYDMRIGVEDIAGTSYRIDHFIDLEWSSAEPGLIAGEITSLMRILGMAYHAEPHFVMEAKPLQRAKGTMYTVIVIVSWVQWLTVTV